MEFLISPWEHQKRGIELAKDQRDFALFFDMGTGKTATVINILRAKFAEEKRLMRTLILCPPVVVQNWQREIKMHSKVGHRAICLQGSQVKRRKIFAQESNKKPAPIFITNYEALLMQDLIKDILEWELEILVCDESHMLKNHKAKRTKMAIMLADRTKHNYILTGTPILNCSRDIWAQYRVMDRGTTFGRNYYAFEKQYFIDANSGMPKHVYFPKWIPREGMYEEFNRLIYQKAMRVMKDECLDLPPLVRSVVDVELAPEQARVYEEMKRDFITYLNDEACVAQLAVTKALRLQQIASGFVKTQQGEEIVLKHNPRLDALREIIEGIPRGEKFIVWSVFRNNYNEIGKLLKDMGVGFVEIHGGVKDKQAAADTFEKDPSIRAMVANQAAGGVGINLVAASYAIFYSRNFSLAQDLQANDRNYRGGSERHKKVTRIDIVARGTIDEVVSESLQKKLDLSQSILELKKIFN